MPKRKYGQAIMAAAMGRPQIKRSRLDYRTGGYGAMTSRKSLGKSTELKYKDTSDDNQALSAGTPEVLFNTQGSIVALEEGTGPSQRVGRHAQIRHVELKFHVEWPEQTDVSADGAAGQRCRIVLVKDKQANKAAPAWTDVFEENSTDNTTEFLNLEQSRRFKVLRDIVLRPQTYVSGGAHDGTSTNLSFARGRDSMLHYKFAISLPVEYDGTSGSPSVSEIVSNNLVVMAACEGTGCTVNSQARIRFADP
jgi:hypothetical protein